MKRRAVKKRPLSDMLEELLTIDAPPGAKLGLLEDSARQLAEARGRPVDAYEAVFLTQMAKALAGDTSAAAFVRDSAGDKPGGARGEAAAPALSENDRALLKNLDALGRLETRRRKKGGGA